jgi:hypothetical protein
MFLPSTTLPGVASKIEGVIQGSSTSHPPRLTPLTFSLPKAKGRSLLLRPDMGLAGAALPTVASKATAATAVEVTFAEKIMTGNRRVLISV